MAQPQEIAGQSANAKGGVSLFREAWAEMPMGRRLFLMGAAALIVGGFVALMLWVNRPDYQVLYSGLAQGDAAQVVEKLKELKVPYQLDRGGNTILVPQDQVYDTRLAMASAGLPQGAGVGMEVFNETKMGTTEFVQKINYQRALQGELARTIASFGEVIDARVHIVMPRDSLFVEDEKKPTAAVVLKLAAGRTLAQSQIQGIVHLVASAVPDLDANHVTVVDSQGNLLYRKDPNAEGNIPGALSSTQSEFQRTTEAQVANKVQTMLESVLGMGRAVVRVSADIDFTRTEEVEDLFNPDQTAVRSETRSTESSKNAGDMPAGAPDERFTLAQANAAPGLEETGKSERTREDETTNFEISRTKRSVVKPLGGVQRLSVAVMVDGPYKETTAESGEVTRTFTPRSAEELRQLTDLVKRAVGFDENRGDEVTVANVPFALPTGAGGLAAKGWQDYLSEYGRPALNVVLVLLFFLMVVRPLMKGMAQRAKVREVERISTEARVGPAEELPPGQGPAEAPQIEAGEPERKLGTRDLILALTQQDPERANAVLRAWMHKAG